MMWMEEKKMFKNTNEVSASFPQQNHPSASTHHSKWFIIVI